MGWLPAANRRLRRGLARPLVLPAIGFAGGCAASGYSTAIWVGLVLSALGAYLLWRARRAVFVAGCLVLLGFGLGLSRGTVAAQRPHLNDLTLPRLCTVTGAVASEPTHRPYSSTFLLDGRTIRAGLAATRPMSETISVTVTGAALPQALGLDSGDEVRVDGILDRVRGEHNPDVFATDGWMRAQGISAELRAKTPGSVQRLGFGGNALSIAVGAMRRRSEDIFAAGLTPPDAAAATAIFLGDKTDLPPSFASAFATTGTIHLLATAGLHVGILVVSLQLLLRLLTIPRKQAALIGIVMVWFYAGMAGGRPAVERAAFVATVYFAALIVERIPDLLSAVALCVLVLLGLKPSEVFDPGFQLSFMTVLGIIAIMPVLLQVFGGVLSKLKTGHCDRVVRRLVEVECLSLSAQAASAPLVAVYFNLVTIYGLGANLIACPLMFLLMPIALVTLVLGAAWAPAGIVCARVVLTPVLRLVVGCVGAVASLPHCAVAVRSPNWFEVAVYYAAVFGGSLAIQIALDRRNGDCRGDRAPAAQLADRVALDGAVAPGGASGHRD
jgi:competence protein ComEC